jgi:hypothetical protein
MKLLCVLLLCGYGLLELQISHLQRELFQDQESNSKHVIDLAKDITKQADTELLIAKTVTITETQIGQLATQINMLAKASENNSKSILILTKRY